MMSVNLPDHASHANSCTARYAKAVHERRNGRKTLIALLIAALAVRLAWGLSRPVELDARLGDQFEYLQLGRNLWHDHQLRVWDDRFDQWVYAYRTPGYPLLIAACGGRITAVRIVQAILDTSTVLAVYLLCRRWFGGWGPIASGALVAFNPYLVYFSGLILSETLFTCMLTWGMWLVTRDRKWAFGLLLLALSTLVRPSALGLTVILAGAAAWPSGWAAVIRNASVAAAFVLLVLAPWAIRNARHPSVSAWIWTTTNEGVTTYDGFHDGATGASDQKAFISEMGGLLSHMDEVERDAYLGQRAHEWIRAHPIESLKLMVMKIGRTWSPVPLSNEYGGNGLYVLAGLIFAVPFDILILLGIWRGDLPRTAKVFLLLPAIYFTAVHALSVGSLRYRIPFEPPMAVIAGSWASTVLGNPHGPSRRKSG